MPITNKWIGVGLTDAGRVRPTNQDSLLIDNHLGLWIVADGMGGHAGGDVASQMAVKTIRTYIAKNKPRKPGAPEEEWKALLNAAVVEANTAIRYRGKTKPALKGMGTTVVCAFMPDPHGEHAWIIHVGDSRAYLIRNQHITALTRDHTLLEERIQVGLLPRSTPSSHELGHVLTRAIGVESIVEPEIAQHRLQPTDEILLCSDGLNKMMNDEQIFEVLQNFSTHTPQQKCQALVDRANERGGKDNTTVVMIQA